jgi:hypothetical protein
MDGKQPKKTQGIPLSDTAAIEELKRKGPSGRGAKTLTVDNSPHSTSPFCAPDTIGMFLVEKGLLSRHQLFNALNESYTRGCSLREALLALEYLSEETLRKEDL